MLCANTEKNTSFLIIIKTGSRFLNTDKVSVQTPATNLVTARFLKSKPFPKRATNGPTNMTDPRRLEHFFKNSSLSK